MRGKNALAYFSATSATTKSKVLRHRRQNAAKNDLSPTGLLEETAENGDGVSESAKKQDESYYEEMLHFLPSLVDISAVQTRIVAAAAGNQHSMILAGEARRAPLGTPVTKFCFLSFENLKLKAVESFITLAPGP